MGTNKGSWRTRTVAAASAALLLVPLVGVSPAAATDGTRHLTHSATLQADYLGNIVIETDNVTLDCAGHTIHGPGAADMVAGVFIDHASGVTVKQCVITGFTVVGSDNGIFVRDSSAVTISGNTVSGNAAQGIVLQRSDGGIVRGNTATGNGANGIHTTDSDGVTVSGNTVSGNAEHGIHILWAVGGKVIGNTSRSNAGLGIAITGSTQVLVKGNTAVGSATWAGIALGMGTTASMVVDNTASHNRGGGFEIWDSSGNTFIGNSANGNTVHGFLLMHSDDNVLTQNTSNGNEAGFYLVGANGNELTENTANGNLSYGFVAVEGSSNNAISHDTGHQNAILDALDEGSGTGDVWLRNSFGTTSGL